MFQSYQPINFSPSMLDKLLANGWFRGGNVMYQTKMLCLDDAVHSVVNIRSDLRGYTFSKSNRKLLRKNKKLFSWSVQPLEITAEKENLYQQHTSKFKGFVHQSLENYLFEGMRFSLFNTFELTVYDGEDLVAASFFDVGKNSMASLLCVYDRDYRKYSLGIFTMLLEVEFALKKEIQYYYPGYIFKGSSIFDYKLKTGNVEYYDWNKWWPLESLEERYFPAQLLNTSFNALKTDLERQELPFNSYLYPYFSLGYANYLDLEFLKNLQFIQVTPLNYEQSMLIVTFDIYSKKYQLLEVKQHLSANFLADTSFSKDMKNEEVYYQELLSIEETLKKSAEVSAIIAIIKQVQNS